MRGSRLIIYLLGFFCVATRIASADSAGDIRRIEKRGEITVAMISEETPPFIFHDSKGELRGIDVEMARQIGEQLKVAVRIDRSAKTFTDLIEMVSNDRADIAISALYSNLERAKKV